MGYIVYVFLYNLIGLGGINMFSFYLFKYLDVKYYYIKNIGGFY